MAYRFPDVRAALALLIILIANNTSAQNLVLSAAPRESVKQGHELYQPLANHLGKLLGVEVKYTNAKHWLRYQSDIKNQKYDFVFDGPHLASWRIKHLKHKPLVKLPGTLEFYILARADSNKINKPEDLVYKKVCAIPPPNLTSVTLLQRLNDPVREPVIESVKGGMGKIFNGLIEGKCEGAVIRSNYFKKKLTNEEHAKVKIIYTSPELPNQVITVSDRVSEEDRKKIILSLTTGEGMKAMAPIVKRFGGKNVKGFVEVKPGEYDGYFAFLEGVVLGW
ncbi:MAG: phosphate/phosphite/phosphonate ABC transporter substrate-binding protein [Gammaproteobacteria bacterium]|nr:phosphate/phosphite/phosphonate ABC transporter substrate-binding protein [Gammaproteobacteria bacterium]